MTRFKQISFWLLTLGVLGGVAGFVACGFALGQYKASRDSATASDERQALIKRFPAVRQEGYASGAAAAQAKIDVLQQQVNDFGDIKGLIKDSHAVVTSMLQILGDRAKVADQHSAQLLRQSKATTAVAVDTKQAIEQVHKEVTENTVKVDATASAVQNVEKKLSPPPAPSAPPSRGWFGFGGH